MEKGNTKEIVINMKSAGKRGRGRPRKDVVINEIDMIETTSLPGMFQPSTYDIVDELSRFDSYAYGKYN